MNSNERFYNFLTVDEMANYLRIGRSKAYQICQQEDFPKITLGKKIRIPREELNSWISHKLRNG